MCFKRLKLFLTFFKNVKMVWVIYIYLFKHNKNKLFFNVRIACLLNTAEKSVYLVGSYLQTYNPIVKSIFIISFFQHKKIQKPVWYYCSPVCFQSLKKEKNIFFFYIHVNFANNIYGTFSKFSLFWRTSLCVYLTHRY